VSKVFEIDNSITVVNQQLAVKRDRLEILTNRTSDFGLGAKRFDRTLPCNLDEAKSLREAIASDETILADLQKQRLALPLGELECVASLTVVVAATILAPLGKGGQLHEEACTKENVGEEDTLREGGGANQIASEQSCHGWGG
jgi:hypothetical protein